MDYRFTIGTYDEPSLENEIALALDARSALSMRKRGAKPTPAREEKPLGEKETKLRNVLSIACFIIGAAMILYVLTMENRSRLLQVLGFLVIGIGLFVRRSGAADGGSVHARPRSVQQAQKLLIALRQGNFVNGLDVSFSEDKMTLSTKSTSSEVEYDRIHSVIETEHLWFITYGQAGVALQKCDLVCGEAEHFLEQIAAHSGCSTEIVRWHRDETPESAENAETAEISEE